MVKASLANGAAQETHIIFIEKIIDLLVEKHVRINTPIPDVHSSY
jgi:hypothetical protein